MFGINFTNLIVALVRVIPNSAMKSYRSTSRLLGKDYCAKLEHDQMEYYDESSLGESRDLASAKVKEWYNTWMEHVIQKRDSRARRRKTGEKSTLFYAITMPNCQGADTVDRLEIFKFTQAVSNEEAVRSIETGEYESRTFQADLSKSTYDLETHEWVKENVGKLEKMIRHNALGYWKKEPESMPGKVMYIYKIYR